MGPPFSGPDTSDEQTETHKYRNRRNHVQEENPQAQDGRRGRGEPRPKGVRERRGPDGVEKMAFPAPNACCKICFSPPGCRARLKQFKNQIKGKISTGKVANKTTNHSKKLVAQGRLAGSVGATRDS